RKFRALEEAMRRKGSAIGNGSGGVETQSDYYSERPAGEQNASASRDSRSAQGHDELACSFNTRRRIFPDGDFGIASTISYWRICLYPATRSETNRASSSKSSVWPARGTMNAFGISPASASGAPVTPQSSMSGCSSNTASSSAGAMLKLLYLIISFLRSTT